MMEAVVMGNRTDSFLTFQHNLEGGGGGGIEGTSSDS